jgi:hypothetical protein
MSIKKWEGPVYLEPIEHKYHHRVTGEKFSSVTGSLGLVEPHFDAEAVALAIENQQDENKKEEYIGLTQEEILSVWKEINDEANRYGSKVHDTIEKYLLNNKWYFPDDSEEGIFESKIISAFEEVGIDEGITMWPERILFSESYKLAGMSDLIIDIDDCFFDVGDYKTNKEFRYYNPYCHQTLLPPFEHLQNCQWSIYTLQLSLYAYMYELEFPNKKCRQIYVLYWDRATEKFSKIHMMYMKNEAKRLIEMHYYNILKNEK